MVCRIHSLEGVLTKVSLSASSEARAAAQATDTGSPQTTEQGLGMSPQVPSTAVVSSPTSVPLAKLQRTAARSAPTTAASSAQPQLSTAVEPVSTAQLPDATSLGENALDVSGRKAALQGDSSGSVAARQQQADAVATAGASPTAGTAQPAAAHAPPATAADKSTEPDLVSPGSFSA